LAFSPNPINPNSAGDIRGVELAAREIGQNLRVFKASTLVEIERSFEIWQERKMPGYLLRQTHSF